MKVKVFIGRDCAEWEEIHAYWPETRPNFRGVRYISFNNTIDPNNMLHDLNLHTVSTFANP